MTVHAIMITPPASFAFAVTDEAIQRKLEPARRASYAPPPEQRANPPSLQEQRDQLTERRLKVMMAAESALVLSEPLDDEPQRRKMLSLMSSLNREKAILLRAERLLGVS